MSSGTTSTVVGEAEMGMALRLLFLMSHYRKPLDFTHEKLEGTRKMLAKWHTRAVRGENTSPPVEVIEALEDDLNTPKAIAVMHGFYAKRDGEKLYASMVFLGLVPGAHAKGLLDLENKTEPLPGSLPTGGPLLTSAA